MDEIARDRLRRFEDRSKLVGAVLVSDRVALHEVLCRCDESVDLTGFYPGVGVCLPRCLEDQLAE